MKIRIGFSLTTLAVAAAMTTLVTGCNKSDDTKGTPPPSTTIGTEIDDSALTTRVKSALVADPDVKSFDIQVETRKGEVQLSGFVDNQAQIERARAVAQGVSGVKTVISKLTLKEGGSTAGAKVDDGIVTTKVKAALLADANVKSQDIAVVTHNGEVQLSGFVDSQNQIDHALQIARGVEGVSNVLNEMSIKK